LGHDRFPRRRTRACDKNGEQADAWMTKNLNYLVFLR